MIYICNLLLKKNIRIFGIWSFDLIKYCIEKYYTYLQIIYNYQIKHATLIVLRSQNKKNMLIICLLKMIFILSPCTTKGNLFLSRISSR